MDPDSPRAASPHEPADPDPLALLEKCLTSPIEREGVPMFVGVHDARPRAAGVVGRAAGGPDAVLRGEAEQLRRLYDTYVAGLAPGRDERRPSPDPTGGAWSLIEVLVVMSEAHLRSPVGLGEPGAAEVP